jgi:L(+)-tartrate dehydratase beta subunit
VGKFGPCPVESGFVGRYPFACENAKIAPGLERPYAGAKSATLRRYGETDDKTEEVI